MAEKKNSKRQPGGSAPGGGGAGGPMDVGLLEQIVRLMAENDLNTVDLRDGARRVILKRGPEVVSVAPMAAGYAAPAAVPAPAAVSSSPTSAGSPAPPAGGGAASDAGLVPIKSEMVGTFYVAPKQGEKPFVSVGSVVNEETDICIIEAMKTFNTFKAGVSGTIAKVLVTDGQTVQFDQPLFLVKPS